MTAVPADADDGTLTLVCDGCGQSVPDIDSRRENWPVVWAIVSKYGWVGSPAAIGPHRCPECSGLPSATSPDEPLRETPGSGLRTSISRHGDACVLRLAGNLDLLVAGELNDALTDALIRCPNIVLHLAGVRMLDSTALGLLVRTRQAARQAGGHLCLVAPSGFVLTVLHTMRLWPAFQIFPDTQEALRWLVSGPAPQ